MLSKFILEEIAALTATGITDVEAKFKAETGEFKSDEEIAVEFKNLMTARFSKIKEDVSGETKRKTLAQIEKDLKKTFDYEGSEQGLELQKAIVERAKAKAIEGLDNPKTVLPDFSQFTPQDWAKIDPFNSKVKEVTLELEAKNEALKAEFAAKETARQMEAEKQGKKDLLKSKLLALKPAGLTDTTKDKMIDSFFNTEFDFNKIVVQNNEMQFLDANGDIILDERHIPVTADVLLKTKWWSGFDIVPQLNPTPNPSNNVGGNGQTDSDIKTSLNSIFQKKGSPVQFFNSLPQERKTMAHEYWKSLNK